MKKSEIEIGETYKASTYHGNNKVTVLDKPRPNKYSPTVYEWPCMYDGEEEGSPVHWIPSKDFHNKWTEEDEVTYQRQQVNRDRAEEVQHRLTTFGFVGGGIVRVHGDNKLRLFFDGDDAEKVMERLECAHVFLTEVDKGMEK